MSQMPRNDPPPNFAKHMGKSERDKGEQKPIPEIIHDIEHKKTYVRGKFLGKGGFAKCYELKTSDNKILAGKIISKSILVKDHHRQKIASEIELHRDLKHKYVVGFFSYFEDDAFVYIILELCSKKSLMELIKRRRYLTEIECRYFFHQIMIGVAYLHENSIIHRDLKLGNIFITEDMMVKIGDFGLATRVSEDRKMTLCGTPNYIAPEVLSKTGHSLEVDIWSCGCILYTFFTGKPPFETATLKETYHKIKSGDYAFPPNKIASLARSLISKMLQVNPKNRPNCKQVLSNEWMKGYIPAALPASCLTMPPRALEKAFPNINNPKRVLADQNHKPSSPIPQPILSNGKPMPIPKGVRREKENAVGYSSPSQQKNDINNKNEIQQQEFSHRTSAAHYMKLLTTQLKDLLNTAPSSAKRPKFDDDSEAPNLAPMLWVSKWVDYSDKYGFGYQLSDDSIGVNFNDLTKMVILCDQFNIRYFDKDGNEEFFTKEKYPTEHSKKIKLLNYFQQYMNENLLKAGASLSQVETGSMARLPNMWTWFRTSRAVVMILSNGTLQINNFRDHTKMILCPLMSAITLLEDNQTMRTYKFESIEKYGCTEELGHKLTYALEKLEAIAAKTDHAIRN